jgi:hypothetical protein
VERERRKGRGNIHLYKKIPEWNSLCWLVESEREEKERRKVALLETEKQELSRSVNCTSQTF